MLEPDLMESKSRKPLLIIASLAQLEILISLLKEDVKNILIMLASAHLMTQKEKCAPGNITLNVDISITISNV